MKTYKSFDLWYADQTAKNKKLISSLRKIVKAAAPKLEEASKWGNACWLKNEKAAIFLYVDKDHIQFGFFNGATLPDPKGLLQGKGAHLRHVKIRTAADIDEARLSRWIKWSKHPTDKR